MSGPRGSSRMYLCGVLGRHGLGSLWGWPGGQGVPRPGVAGRAGSRALRSNGNVRERGAPDGKLALPDAERLCAFTGSKKPGLSASWCPGSSAPLATQAPRNCSHTSTGLNSSNSQGPMRPPSISLHPPSHVSPRHCPDDSIMLCSSASSLSLLGAI